MWALPAALALLLGLWHLGRPLLWRDELASWSAARRTTGQLWGLLDHVDAVSGAYYFLLHFWIRVFSGSAVGLRLPSVLATAATAGLTALVGRRLFRPRVGLWAGILFALVPTVLRFAQEARSYALADTAVLLATWQLLFLLDRAERRCRWREAGAWAGYGATLALIGLLHLVGLSVLAAHAWLLITRRRRAWRGFVSAVALAVLALSPLLLIGQGQSDRQTGWTVRPSLNAVPGFLQNLTSGGLFGLALLVLAVVGMLSRSGLMYSPVPFLPIATVWICSQGAHSYWVERYLLFVVPLWTILAAAGVDKLPWSRWIAPFAVLLVAGLASDGIRIDSLEFSHTGVDWRSGAAVIALGYQAGDAIVPERGVDALFMTDLGISYYLPQSSQPRDIFVSIPAVARNDLFALECTLPVVCLNGAHRVWVVTDGHASAPLGGLLPSQQAALRSNYRVTELHYVRGLTVTLLTLRTQGP